ncbi:hypothetical protein [Microvirga sp. VF16]|uniref:hypothetical protein n=1 Tax=Microvirga sp. VF16 TaxID=2807101 RepID=UPI00193E4ED7|nr:hypothetical protein [Microvirga sp. VF16]QRM34922.1 hypothetical protein JO965_42440 [Microvirga sp. VF16]
MNATASSIQALSQEAGWKDSTTLVLIGQWAERTGQASALLQHLNDVARHEEENLSSETKMLRAHTAGYTVRERAPGAFVFNDPDGNDADNGPWPTESAAWNAAYADF